MRYAPWLMILVCLMAFSGMKGQTTLEKANKAYELQAYPLAAESYEALLLTHPNNAALLTQLGKSYYYQNLVDEAIATFQKAVTLPDVPSDAILFLGKSLMERERYDEARTQFAAYRAISPAVSNHFTTVVAFAQQQQELPTVYKVKKEFLNTASADYCASFIGTEVVYSSTRQDIDRKVMTKSGHAWSGSNQNQLYITAKDANGFLMKPSHLQSDLANQYNEGPVAYSPKGMVAITKNNFRDGTRMEANIRAGMSLFLAKKKPDGSWTDAYSFPYNGEYSVGFPAFSNSGNTLFFASDMPGGRGGFDIYYSQLVEDKWTEPVNVGPLVNSAGDEITPFWSEGQLFFSSNWQPGFGGFDIFRANVMDGEITQVYHLGSGVNSPSDDYGFIYNPTDNLGYITSNRTESSGAEDIFRINRISDRVQIKVIDAITKKPIPGALIDFSLCGEGQYVAGDNGVYSFQALEGLNCEAKINYQGYQTSTLLVSNTQGSDNLEYEIAITADNSLYPGVVIDVLTGKGLEDVVVTATSSNGVVTQATTDKEGGYQLPLEEKSAYNIIYSKAGYANDTTYLTEVDSDVRSMIGVLGTTTLINAYTKATIENNEAVAKASKENAAKEVAVAPTSPTEVADTKDAVVSEHDGVVADLDSADDIATTAVAATTDKVYAKGAPPEAIAEVSEKGAEDQNLEERYAVQIDAFRSNTNIVNITSYQDLFDLGNVYTRPDGALIKVRLGVFETREQAKAILKKAKSKGYPQAFITPEYLSPYNSQDLIVHSSNKKATVANKGPKPQAKPKPVTKPKPAPTPANYRVRLAAYKDTKWFDENKVKDLGKIGHIKDGDYTIYYLTNYASLEDALAAKKAVTAQGFKGAFIESNSSGAWETIQF